MKGRLGRLGIAGRVIVAGIALLVLMAAFVALGVRLVVDPVVREDHEGFPAWLAKHAVVPLEDPARLSEELAATRAQIGAEISVYGPDGALVASSAAPPSRRAP